MSTKKGWLWLEVRKSWEEYWFVLEDGQLRYYEDPSSRKPIERINLDDTEVASCGHARKYFAFRLSHHDGRQKHVLATENEAESLDWAESIIEHGATGLVRALSVKPKASMSFVSFGRNKSIAGSNQAGQASESHFMMPFRSFGRSKGNSAKAALSQASPQQGAPLSTANAELIGASPATTGQRRKAVYFAEEPASKRLSVGA